MSIYDTIDARMPDKAWEVLSADPEGFVEEVDVDTLAPEEQPPDTLRLVIVSDTHHKEGGIVVPPGDVLIHAGDFTDTGELSQCVKFNQWLGTLPHKHKVVIAGNHETTFDKDEYHKLGPRFHGAKPFDPEECRATLTNCVYLENSDITIDGVKIWGSPWSAWFHDWGFNVKRGQPSDDLWSTIPEDTDVLITHGPPIGHGDLCFSGNRAGCVDLLRHVNHRVKPICHIFGHIHEGYGVTRNQHSTFINASTCTFRYRPTNPPIVFDVKLKDIKAKRSEE